MKNYKCVKQPPNTTFEVGQITDNELCEQLPEYFSKYKFTTQDGVDMYVGDKYMFVNNNSIIHGGNFVYAWYHTYETDGGLRFSTREAAKAYLDEQKKPKFEVGKVYKDSHSSLMVLVTKLHFNDGLKVSGYGFNCYGNWADSDFFGINGCKESTPSEWESALIKEAERLYPVGTKYNDVNSNNYVAKVKGKFNYYEDTKIITDGCGGAVYDDGKWAEIIKEPKEKTNREYYNDFHYERPAYNFIEWLDKNNLIIFKNNNK